MILKPKTLAAVVLVIALFVCVCVYVLWPIRTIRRLQARYEQVRRGMSVEEVQSLMAYSPVLASHEWYPGWDDEQLPSAEASRIVSAVRYSVKVFFLPVSFEFTFDSDHRVVGRHIYD